MERMEKIMTRGGGRIRANDRKMKRSVHSWVSMAESHAGTKGRIEEEKNVCFVRWTESY